MMRHWMPCVPAEDCLPCFLMVCERRPRCNRPLCVDNNNALLSLRLCADSPVLGNVSYASPVARLPESQHTRRIVRCHGSRPDATRSSAQFLPLDPDLMSTAGGRRPGRYATAGRTERRGSLAASGNIRTTFKCCVVPARCSCRLAVKRERDLILQPSARPCRLTALGSSPSEVSEFNNVGELVDRTTPRRARRASSAPHFHRHFRRTETGLQPHAHELLRPQPCDSPQLMSTCGHPQISSSNDVRSAARAPALHAVHSLR